MSTSPYRPGNTTNAICCLVPAFLLLWVLRSGALAMWDRHSPVKEGPVVPWLVAVPVAIVGGALVMPLLTFQISLLVDWWRKRRGDQA
jgi:hypothetical protein